MDDFRLFALVILPALVFLGTVTFVRVLETGIEDAIYAQAINRIRHYYLELAGDDARYFVLGGNDDMQGGLANMGLSPSPWRPFFSIASVIALINSMVAGALAGIALDVFAPRAIALIAGGSARRSCSDRPLSARLWPLRPRDGELHATVSVPAVLAPRSPHAQHLTDATPDEQLRLGSLRGHVLLVEPVERRLATDGGAIGGRNRRR